MTRSPAWKSIGAPAIVSVFTLGPQRRVDRREPAALAVADQVHRAADLLDRLVDDVDVVLDRASFVAGVAPIQSRAYARVSPRSRIVASGSARRVVHDARVVAGLRRHTSVGTRRARPGAEVAQPGHRPSGRPFGVDHSGGRRLASSFHQRETSDAASSGVTPRSHALCQYRIVPVEGRAPGVGSGAQGADHQRRGRRRRRAARRMKVMGGTLAVELANLQALGILSSWPVRRRRSVRSSAASES